MEKPFGLIHKEMIKHIQERVIFKIVASGTSFNPQFIRRVVDIAFEEAEKLGLVELIQEE